MDSSFTVKPPRPGAPKLYTPRDPVPVREAVETELETTKTVTAAGDGGARQGARRHDDDKPGEHRHEPLPQDVVVDPASREVIYRERDVRTADREHPDQALARQRAYRQTPPDAEHAPPAEPHANIKA